MDNMVECFLPNPYPDFEGDKDTDVTYNKEYIKDMIFTYVDDILDNCAPEVNGNNMDERGDLYLGNAGIAYMFWKLNNSYQTKHLYPDAMYHAKAYIRNAREHATLFQRRPAERFSFFCGNAGIYAVGAAISYQLQENEDMMTDLTNFKTGIAASLEHNCMKQGDNDILVGRAGFLFGCHWLNDILPPELHISDENTMAICDKIIRNGRKYAKQTGSNLPILFQFYGTEYLGAAHGLSGIMQSLLCSTWFRSSPHISAPPAALRVIGRTVDQILLLQDEVGNYPVSLNDLRTGRDKRYVQWCHGAPGTVYMLAKAYLVFKKDTYLLALRRAADLVWKKGFLPKGCGLCHGVAGNGYVFLLLFRLTKEMKYLYRAIKFMKFLTDPEFKMRARTPDHPHSLFEGTAGTVCFLIDLLEPEKAHFPFMDVFN